MHDLNTIRMLEIYSRLDSLCGEPVSRVDADAVMKDAPDEETGREHLVNLGRTLAVADELLDLAVTEDEAGNEGAAKAIRAALRRFFGNENSDRPVVKHLIRMAQADEGDELCGIYANVQRSLANVMHGGDSLFQSAVTLSVQ